jgi:lantibiotic modifying enzyme
MSFTAAEIETIVKSVGTGSAAHVRRMLTALDHIEFNARRGTPLRKLCAAGVEYGWTQLEQAIRADVLAQTSTKTQASLRRHLQRSLERITRPSLELEWTSFVIAMNSLGLAPGTDRGVSERMFLRDRPSHRLVGLFRKFPVLAHLWYLAIDQWRGHVVEVLDRVAKDRGAISRFFFDKHFCGQIKDLRPGLSDPHNRGRSVTLIDFERGRLIYKPRSGLSESTWFSLLTWMNHHGFQPKLRAARVLQRKGFSWMEYAKPASCKNEAAVRRFYERLGGMIAAVYLLKAVDCHRENLIAAGEYPVLVDVDALWHVSQVTERQSLVDVLYRTGFFPNSKRRSLQSRSSVLGPATTGNHLACLGGKRVVAAHYMKEIILGFSRGWHCLIGTPSRRVAILKKLRRIRARPRRWIYLATEKYAGLLAASVQPAALRSEAAREALITRSCLRSSVSRAVVQAEIKALTQLDLPYFVRTTAESMPADKSSAPPELTDAIRNTLQLAKSYRKGANSSTSNRYRSGSPLRSAARRRHSA